MKAINEFESVLVIAGLIISVCALMDLSLAAPGTGATRQGSDYSGYVAPRSFDLAQQDSIDITGTGAPASTVSVTEPVADDSRWQAPARSTDASRQGGISW